MGSRRVSGTRSAARPAAALPLAAAAPATAEPKVWKPALLTAGLLPTRENAMHALRHFYASVLLDAGESIRALAEYLGHADPGFTLRVYTHLTSASEQRTKQAVDQALRRAMLADGSTGRAPDVHHQATEGLYPQVREA